MKRIKKTLSKKQRRNQSKVEQIMKSFFNSISLYIKNKSNINRAIIAKYNTQLNFSQMNVLTEITNENTTLNKTKENLKVNFPQKESEEVNIKLLKEIISRTKEINRKMKQYNISRDDLSDFDEKLLLKAKEAKNI